MNFIELCLWGAIAAGAGACVTPIEARGDSNAPIGATSPRAEDPTVLRSYSPSSSHLALADQQMREAFEHQAEHLQKYEDVACEGVSKSLRANCPLLAPYIEQIQERVSGVTLQLKSGAPAVALASQMRCHLAFAKATGFKRAPCPLYLEGVTIELQDGGRIDVFSSQPDVADRVRQQARLMFGEDLVARIP